MLIYAAMGLQSGAWLGFPGQTEVLFGANFAPLVREGEWFRVVTSTFLHGGALHIGMNMVALHQVGIVLEPFYGRVRFVAVYLLCGVAASLASLFLHAEPTLSVGASGAIAGLIGAGVVAGQVVGTDQGRRFRDAMLRWGGTIIVFGFVVPGIDNVAHVGGFIAGIVAAAVLSPGLRRRSASGEGPPGARETVLAATLLILVVAVSFAFAFRAAQPPDDSGLADPPSLRP